MSTSAKLSETHTHFGGGRGIQNAAAISQEKKVRSQQATILDTLSGAFPSLHFSHTRQLSKTDINASMHRLHDEFGVYQSNSHASIRPDGGFFWVHLPNGTKKLVLCSEAKKQGTNDRRSEAGLKDQAKGNAVERTVKNVEEVRNYMSNENYFPYLIMISGCDLIEDSSIRDRVTSCNRGSIPNVIYVKNVKVRGQSYARASLFMRCEEWTEEEVRDRSLEVAFAALDVILSEYYGLDYDRCNER